MTTAPKLERIEADFAAIVKEPMMSSQWKPMFSSALWGDRVVNSLSVSRSRMDRRSWLNVMGVSVIELNAFMI